MKSKSFPIDLPRQPAEYYKGEYESFDKFIGFNYISFDELKQLVKKNKINSSSEWRKFYQKNKKLNIPSKPYNAYKNVWINWGDFLGTGVVWTGAKKI